MYSSSAARYRTFRVTTTTPIRAAPKNSSSHSAWLAAATAIRSPGPMPRASSPAATCRPRRSSSAYVTVTRAARSDAQCRNTRSGATAAPASGASMPEYDYVRDAAEIYRRSFATIRAEADLAGLPADVATVAVRMIHTCGMTDLPADLACSPDVVAEGRAALAAGAPVLCDTNMVASGVTRRRLPADNEVLCLLGEPGLPELAARLGTTRTAAAVDLWADRLAGAVVAIGNAPTALFRLLE